MCKSQNKHHSHKSSLNPDELNDGVVMTVSVTVAGNNKIKHSLEFKMAPLKITTEVCTVCNPFAKNCVRAIQADFCIISHHLRTKNCIMAGSYIYWWQLPTRRL